MQKPPLIPTLIVLFFIILMTNLGFWQLNRAHEKEGLLVLLADDNITKVNHAKQIKDLPQYSNIEIKGRFLKSPQLLLDNQIDNQQIGYHVFTPFVMDGVNLFIMVNRGWVAKDGFDINGVDAIDSSKITLFGKLNHSPQVGIQLGEIELDGDKASQIITYYDRQKISSFLHEKLCEDLNCSVSDRILLLDKNQNQGFIREWNPIVMSPAKHFGYAVQWFLMTLVLIVLFIYWVSKLKK